MGGTAAAAAAGDVVAVFAVCAADCCWLPASGLLSGDILPLFLEFPSSFNDGDDRPFLILPFGDRGAGDAGVSGRSDLASDKSGLGLFLLGSV